MPRPLLLILTTAVAISVGLIAAADNSAPPGGYRERVARWVAAIDRDCEARVVACLAERQTCDVLILCGRVQPPSIAVVRLDCEPAVCQTIVDVRH